MGAKPLSGEVSRSDAFGRTGTSLSLVRQSLSARVRSGADASIPDFSLGAILARAGARGKGRPRRQGRIPGAAMVSS